MLQISAAFLLLQIGAKFFTGWSRYYKLEQIITYQGRGALLQKRTSLRMFFKDLVIYWKEFYQISLVPYSYYQSFHFRQGANLQEFVALFVTLFEKLIYQFEDSLPRTRFLEMFCEKMVLKNFGKSMRKLLEWRTFSINWKVLNRGCFGLIFG